MVVTVGSCLWLLPQFPKVGNGRVIGMPVGLALIVGAFLLYLVIMAWLGKGSMQVYLLLIVLFAICYVFYVNLDGQIGIVNPCPGADIGVGRVGGDCIRGIDLGGGK